jgi:hypothetical protein
MTDQPKQSVPEMHFQNLQWCQTRTNRSGSGSSLLQVPSERYGGLNRRSSSGIKFNEILFEEESDVIKNCCEISSAVLGLMKSFSTSDICSLNETSPQSAALRQTTSEIMLFGGVTRLELPNIRRLDYTSRSCSTWANLGDPISSTSQLPSPQAQSAKQVDLTTITSLDFIKSVNKKVRQIYLRRRLRAIGRLVSSCQMNLNDSVKVVSSSPITLDTDKSSTIKTVVPNIQIQESQSLKAMRTSFDFTNLCFKTVDGTLSLTVKDIERDKGKPLSKYERNIMIFNWLQNVDEGDATEQIESA